MPATAVAAACSKPTPRHGVVRARAAVSQKHASDASSSSEGVAAATPPATDCDGEESRHEDACEMVADGGGGVHEAIRAAKKRRYAKEFQEFEVGAVLAVKGGRLKDMIALKTVELGGVQFAPMRYRETWISMTMMGRADEAGRYAFGLKELKKRVQATMPADSPSEACEMYEAVHRGMRALDARDEEQSDSSDEEAHAAEMAHARALAAEEGATAFKPREPGGGRTTRKKLCGPVIKKLTIMEEDVSFCILKDVLHVEATARSMGTVIRYFGQELSVPRTLRDRRAAAKSQLGKAPESIADGQSHYGLIDKNRVFLHSKVTGRQSWRVTYISHEMKRLFWSKGLAVSHSLTEAARDAELRQKLSWARFLWNELDKSDKPRYLISPDDQAHIRSTLRASHVYLG